MLPLTLAGPAAAAVSTPAARWTMDAGSGSSVSDAVGSATGTKAGGASWITSGAAVGSGAMHFDGVDGRIDVPSQAAIEPGELALTMWVRAPANDAPTHPMVIAEKGSFGCGAVSWSVAMIANGFQFRWRGASGMDYSGAISYQTLRTPVWDGEWHLLSFAVNNTDSFFSIAVDGSPRLLLNWDYEGTATQRVKYSGATSSVLRIGGPLDTACGGTFFEGDIDDVRIYADGEFESGSLMAPIPTTTTVSDVPSPIRIDGTYAFHLQVSPAPRWGVTRIDFLDAATNEVIEGSPVELKADGTLDVPVAGVPHAAGTYNLRARYLGQGPWQPSEDSSTFTATRVPTTVGLEVSPASPAALNQTVLTATVTGDAEIYEKRPEGSVKFYDSTSGTAVLLGTVATEPLGYSTYGVSRAVLTLPSGLDVGSRKLTAAYTTSDLVYGSSTSPVSTIVVPKVASYVGLSGPASVEANHTIPLSAEVQPTGSWSATGATVAFYRSGVATPICTVAAGTVKTVCNAPALPVGSYQFRAVYSGNARTLSGTSAWLPVSVVPDVVHATGVGVQYSTFYPVTDTYRDTVAIKGSRQESIAVTIRIYTPGGTLIKTVSVAAGTGAYSHAWNGRTSTGTIRAEGTYKVTQTLKDAAGTTKSFTHYVTLSKKKLYTYSTTITRKGSTIAASGTEGTGSISRNTTAGTAVVKSGSSGWAGVGYAFTLPSATVYKSIKFRVYSKSGIGPYLQIGMQNFSTCPYNATADWDEACFDHWDGIGNATNTLAYFSTTGSVTTNRSGLNARGMLSVGGGTVTIYKAQILLTYQVLKY